MQRQNEIEIINPTTGELLSHYPEMTASEVEEIIQQVEQARGLHQKTTFAERSIKMKRLGQIFREKQNEFATMITQEMGKPITQARMEIDKCALLCDHYANKAEQYLAPQIIETDYSKSYVSYQPLGVIFAVMPWNFPFWQVMRFAVPNVMAGNGVLLKHAPNSTGAALMIEAAFQAAGFETNVFRALVFSIPRTENKSNLDLAAYCIEHPIVKGVTLTGSARAGKSVGALAGKALKKAVLELGGSDPYLILEDADLDLAAQECLTSRLSNAGQICIAAKRMIVVDSIREAFIEKLLAKVGEYQCADPMNPQTTLGPMARADLRDHLHDQIRRSIQAGARLVLGGEKPEGPGYFYPATVLLDVKKGMPAYEEELFGPVICVIQARDLEEAIEIANDSDFGLGAAVFTQDLAQGEKIARERLNVGVCHVNIRVSSNPGLPFGGSKASGYGRELGAEGIREFMNVKTVVIR